MAGIAILGYGNVGKGTASVLSNTGLISQKVGEAVTIRHILDKSSFPGDPLESLITRDIDRILSDEGVGVIVEALGGIEPAFTFASKTLAAGKGYVTSNKELVAERGGELMQIAKRNNASFLFEASVGGGMPVIRPLADFLSADEALGLAGILNGTTNYILTKMESGTVSYEEALAEAQRDGLAESDPRADVCGHDAARKLAILISLITGTHVGSQNIPTEGIEHITAKDIQQAKKTGHKIKLVAQAVKTETGFALRVGPALVPEGDPLSMINDVYNCVCIQGRATGLLSFTGIGAGGLPTGCAVVSDVIDALLRPGFDNRIFWRADGYKPTSQTGEFKYRGFA